MPVNIRFHPKWLLIQLLVLFDCSIKHLLVSGVYGFSPGPSDSIPYTLDEIDGYLHPNWEPGSNKFLGISFCMDGNSRNLKNIEALNKLLQPIIEKLEAID